MGEFLLDVKICGEEGERDDTREWIFLSYVKVLVYIDL